MSCPRCGGTLEEIPIVKYNSYKLHGINQFCTNRDCDYELDY
jgi:hypothetical protein